MYKHRVAIPRTRLPWVKPPPTRRLFKAAVTHIKLASPPARSQKTRIASGTLRGGDGYTDGSPGMREATNLTEYFYAPSLSGGNKEFLGDMYCRMTSGGDYFMYLLLLVFNG